MPRLRACEGYVGQHQKPHDWFETPLRYYRCACSLWSIGQVTATIGEAFKRDFYPLCQGVASFSVVPLLILPLGINLTLNLYLSPKVSSPTWGSRRRPPRTWARWPCTSPPRPGPSSPARTYPPRRRSSSGPPHPVPRIFKVVKTKRVKGIESDTGSTKTSFKQ